jgi:hypothetical protein
MNEVELVYPTVEEARLAYRQAWFGYCLNHTRESRYDQLMIMVAMKPFCALVRNGREWRRFTATIPGYTSYLKRRLHEEGLED